jgi:hypothetical protein
MTEPAREATRERRLHLEIAIDSADDRRLLRGALLAARSSELAEIRRRDVRLGAGYGSDSAREGMAAEVDQAQRRVDLLDRLIAALAGDG